MRALAALLFAARLAGGGDLDDLPAHSTLPPGETRVGVPPGSSALADAGTPRSKLPTCRSSEARLGAGAAPMAGGRPPARQPPGRTPEDAAAFDDVVHNEQFDGLLGPGGGRWLRYPTWWRRGSRYQRGPQVLASRGYRVASVTLSDDYA